MKSYFNVPDHINNTNRHLGIEKNVRKNKKEPKAKKKHRIARLKFLNNKRNIEIFQMSINAMYEHIESLIEYYNEIRIQEEERILNLELERQRIIEEAELQKQIEIDNYNKFIVDIQKQLDLIPRYKAYMQKILYENKLIEEEKKRLEELLLIEKNEKLLNKYKTYFDIINSKKDENIRLAEELENRTRLENEYKKYIVNKKNQDDKFQEVYQKAIDINTKILNDKISMQNVLETWESNIHSYKNYTESYSEYLENKIDEELALEHKNKLDAFKSRFLELNNDVSLILQNISKNKNELQNIDNENNVDTDIVIDPVEINKTYTQHFEYALQNMKKMQNYRIQKINELKKIEQEQKELLAKKEIENKNLIKKEVEEFSKALNLKRLEHKKFIQKQKAIEMKKIEDEKISAKNALELKTIKLKNDIKKFTTEIKYFNKHRDIIMKEYEEQQKQLQITKDNKIKEEKEKELIIAKRKRNIEIFNNIEETVKEIQEKQIKDINDKYNKYQAEIIRLEQEKQQQMLLEQEKTRIANEKYNSQKLLLNQLEEEYNNIILLEKKQKEEEALKQKTEEKKLNEINNYFTDHFTEIKLARIRQEEIKLLKEQEELRIQEVKEYEEKLAYDNNIQYYSQLIIDNKKQHEIFQKQLEDFKQSEIERLEMIKAEEIMTNNKNIVGFSINHILDLVDVEIESIEYTKTIEEYNNKINQFYKNIDNKKLELKKLAQQQLEEEKNDKLRLEEEERYLKELKKQQEDEMMDQINSMLLEFRINTENHIETIKLHKQKLHQEQLEREEEERLNLIQLEKLEKVKQKQIIEYYKQHLYNHKDNIDKYKKYIQEIEKEKEEKLKAYELAEKKRKEQYEKDLIKKHQNLIEQYYKDIDYMKNNIASMKELQIEQERQAELEKQNIIENQKREQEEIQKKYIEYYSNIIKISTENYEKLQKEKEEAKIQYEIEQKRLLEDAKKNKELLFKKSLDKYKLHIENIKKLKESEEKKIQQQKQLEEEYKKEQDRISKQIEEDIKKAYDNKINIFHNKLAMLEKSYEEEQINREKEKKMLEEEMLQAKKKQEEDYKLKMIRLKDKYKNDIMIMHNNFTAYKENLKREEEEKLLKELQDNKIAEENYNLKMSQLEDKYNNDIMIMHDNFTAYKENLKREEEEKLLKELQEKKIAEENYNLKMNQLEDKYKNDIMIMHNKLITYKANLKKIEEEELLKQIEEEKIAQDNYNKSIILYENEINQHNKYISDSIKEIEEADIRKKEELLELEKQKELELQKKKIENIKAYEEHIQNFYLQQKNVINKLQKELIIEKEKEHNNKLLDLENEIRDKIKNIDKSEFIKKIDKTINFIKDISDNKENEKYINDLKNQYDNSKTVITDDTFVQDNDIISVTDDILKFSDFDKYNKYMYNVVPKIIYQTWPTKNLTRNMAWVVNRIKTTHPDFEYHLFDDNDCRKFIKEHFNMETLWAFDKLIPGAYKADLWRYCGRYIFRYKNVSN